uniref:AP2/ERF domain-containing protein n=1 Tax=Aegilops tauschii TaxID=37682 RepID=R7W7P7_AEGTA
MAARAHDSASLALSGSAACLNFADSPWRMLPVLAAGSSSFSSAREIKDAVAVAVVAFQRQRPVASTADGEKDVQGSPTPSELSTSSDLLDEHWFGGTNAGSYYSPGMFMESPEQPENHELGGGDVKTPLWTVTDVQLKCWDTEFLHSEFGVHHGMVAYAPRTRTSL